MSSPSRTANGSLPTKPLGTENGVAKTFWRFLTNRYDVDHIGNFLDHFQMFQIVAGFELFFQFKGAVKMVFNALLVGIGNQADFIRCRNLRPLQ